MVTIGIDSEMIIRNHVQYYLKNMTGDELEKFIDGAKQQLDKILRDRAAQAVLTLVKSSTVEKDGTEYVIRLELPEMPKETTDG